MRDIHGHHLCVIARNRAGSNGVEQPVCD